ncbi:hypothetical protein FRC02_000400 [Tulasnella sp. 418]|nr:hypothetical protein FRC02_000400 [Tulasnella sp. 418]
MRAYVIEKYIRPSELKPVNDAPEPQPGSNQLLVDVYSAGLNYFDILQVQGKYQNQPPFPWTPGVEFAGVIAANSPTPDGCKLKPGDRVFGSMQGAYADKIACDYRAVYKMPASMTFDEASSLTITWPTSYEGLVGRAELKAAEWVLVHAAAGGVGLVAVQIAKALGAKVIATAGSADKLEVCKRLGGADEVINYRDAGWQKQVMDITKGKGVDVVYDPVGLIQQSLKVIAWKGRVVVVGFAAGAIEKIPMNLVLLKNISIVGLHWGAYISREPARVPEVWAALMALYESGKLKPIIYSEVFSFESLPQGLKAIADRQTWGKAVLRIKEEHSESTPKAKL